MAKIVTAKSRLLRKQLRGQMGNCRTVTAYGRNKMVAGKQGIKNRKSIARGGGKFFLEKILVKTISAMLLSGCGIR